LAWEKIFALDPLKASAIKIIDEKISYNKNKFSFWNSRDLPEVA
jgi:putative transposase